MNHRQEIALRALAVVLAFFSILHGDYNGDLFWQLIVPTLLIGGVTLFGLRTRTTSSDRADGSRMTLPTSERLELVERLAKLRASGALTDEEFQLQKSSVLKAREH